MKHAGQLALDRLDNVLQQLRSLTTLREKTRGVFYWNSRAYLHFHEDAAGLFADLRTLDGADFERRPATSPAEQQALVEIIRRRVGS